MSLKGTISGKQRLTGSLTPRGNDGLSPTIDIAPIEGGTRVTITDINGTKHFDVLGSISKEQIEELIREHLESNPPDFNESDPTVPAWAKQATKPKYTAEEVGALSADSLQPAINDALAQAKVSGEFKGDPGDDYVLTEADKQEIAEQAAGMVEIPEEDVDLTGYATEEWVGKNYQPKGNYLTEVPNDYAKKSELPTKVSQLENDNGYLTEHQDLSGYAKTTDIPTDAHINSLINTALGVIENGTY